MAGSPKLTMHESRPLTPTYHYSGGSRLAAGEGETPAAFSVATTTPRLLPK
jgi:hypothetical protein